LSTSWLSPSYQVVGFLALFDLLVELPDGLFLLLDDRRQVVLLAAQLFEFALEALQVFFLDLELLLHLLALALESRERCAHPSLLCFMRCRFVLLIINQSVQQMSFPEEIISRCRDLAALGYADAAVEAFLRDFPLRDLLAHLARSDLAAEKLFQPRLSLLQILARKPVFLAVLGDPANREGLEQLVAHPYEEQREFLAAVIAQNVEAACEVLEQFAADPSHPTVTGFLKAVYLLLGDKESEVGLKVAKWLASVASAEPDGPCAAGERLAGLPAHLRTEPAAAQRPAHFGRRGGRDPHLRGAGQDGQ